MGGHKECFKHARSHVSLSGPVIIFDVGCNINKIRGGYQEDFTGIALGNFDIEHVWGFEPVHWQRFEEIYQKNEKVTLVKKALDFKSGTQKFFIPPPHGLSSLIKRPGFDTVGFEEQEVETVTLDEFCIENKIDRIDYLKIDAEGAEFRILQGAKDLLQDKRIKAIQFEYGPNGACLKDAGTSLGEVLEYLNGFGYIQRKNESGEILVTL